ncbi:MAG: EAL domain-containing protein [Eubacterium sp.]|nr:EAL domain-containing protein [Eubacterium sp.]
MNFFKRLSVSRYYKYKDEVELRNHINIQAFLLIALLVASINVLSNVGIKKTNGFILSVFILVYFLVATIIRYYFTRDKVRRSTLIFYLIQTPMIIYGILMGTVWDPSTPTITFFLMLICMPVFILDNPFRHTLYIFAMMAIYFALGWYTKNPEVFKIDVVHAISFLMGSVFLNLFVLAERFDNLENYVLSERRARHDEISGLKNRYALRVDSDDFQGENVFFGLIEIGYYKFLNDVYGHVFGEEVVAYLGKLVKETFGEESCFRFESEKVLVIAKDISEKDFKEKLEKVKEDFTEITVDSKIIHPTCIIVYVYGNPDSREMIQDIVRHADVRLSEVQRQKHADVIDGFAYDGSFKRQTDILSEIVTDPSVNSLDAVTGLPNMQFFRVRADELISNVLDMEKEPVVVYYNIGNFKGYNEEYGFRKGDELLRNISAVLKDQFEGKLVSRFAEDHFVVLTYKDTALESLETVKTKIEPLFGNVQMNIKTGIAVCEPGEYVGAICDKAKLACDSIKHDVTKFYAIYDEKLETKNRLSQYVISHIDEAAENGYLKVFYQPVVDINTGKITELEALARWIDPIHGFLSPGDFIPVLEESKLIHKIDMFIARQVCKDQKELQNKAGQVVPVSINLSRLDFMLTDIVEFIINEVKSSNVDPKNLHIEVTESALENNSDDLIEKINLLKANGFEVWLDDFGSGYSSLNSLQEFNFDVIKVDMKFMRTLESNPQTGIIVTAIVQMTKNLGLRSLVEGVETDTQYDFIKNAGVNMAQGFLFSRPVPLEELDFSA